MYFLGICFILYFNNVITNFPTKDFRSKRRILTIQFQAVKDPMHWCAFDRATDTWRRQNEMNKLTFTLSLDHCGFGWSPFLCCSWFQLVGILSS